MSCLVPGCTNPMHSRGLCRGCYMRHSRLGLLIPLAQGGGLVRVLPFGWLGP